MVSNARRRVIHVFLLLLLLLFLCGIPGMGMGAMPQPGASFWKFAVISDTQGDNSKEEGKTCINDAVLREIVTDIVMENPDFVLVAGDLVNGWFKNGQTDYATQYANWKKAMTPVYQAGIQVYPIRGNHDSGPELVALPPLPPRFEPPPDTPVLLKKAFKNAFSEPYIPQNGPIDEEGLTYSFVHKNALVIGLDQFAGGQHKVNQAWLNRRLSANTSPHIFVFGHEPAFEALHPDNLSFYPKERDLFWNSMGKSGARIYFCGHDHFYDRALIPDEAGNPIWQIIMGTSGGALKKNKWSGFYKEGGRVQGQYHNSEHHGYALVKVEGATVTFVWKALVKTGTVTQWQVFDTFTYSIPAAVHQP